METHPKIYPDKPAITTSNNQTSAPFKRFTQGSFANILNNIINIFGQFFLIPIFLTFWGNQLYGEWLALAAVIGYLSLADFGIQTYVLNRLNQYYSKKNLEHYILTFHSAFWGSLIIAFISIISVTIFLMLLPFETWLSFKLTDHKTAVNISIILTFQIILAIPLGLISGIYRTIREYPRGVMVVNVQRTLFFLLTAGVISFGGGPLQAAFVQLIPLIGGTAFIIWDLRRRHPSIQIGIKHRDVKLALSFFEPSLYFFILTLSVILTIQGSTLLVSAVLGSSMVATFVTFRTLAHLIKQMAVPINHALWPELTILETKGHYEKLGFIHQIMVKTILIFGFSSAVFFHFSGGEIINLWTQGKIPYSKGLMDALLLMVITQMFWFPSSVLLSSTNTHKNLGKMSLFSSCIGLLFASFLILPFQLTGVVYGLWLADFTICGWFNPKSACQLTRQDHGKFLYETLFKGIIVFICIYLPMSWAFTIFDFSNALVHLIIFGILVGGTGTSIGYILWFNKNEKEKLKEIINKLIISIPYIIKGKVSQ